VIYKALVERFSSVDIASGAVCTPVVVRKTGAAVWGTAGRGGHHVDSQGAGQEAWRPEVARSQRQPSAWGVVGRPALGAHRHRLGLGRRGRFQPLPQGKLQCDSTEGIQRGNFLDTDLRDPERFGRAGLPNYLRLCHREA
jgi:hypothetical protein